jgi:phytanoyl-CoA hydroxylase
MVVNHTANTARFDDGVAEEYPADLYRFDTIAAGVDGFDAVTDADLDTFREQGYLVIHHAFTPAETDAALTGLLDLIDGARPDFDGIQFETFARDRLDRIPREEKQDYVRKLMAFTAYDERLNLLAQHPKLLAILRRLVRDEPVMFQDMALLKPPGGGREKPWHQDKAFFDMDINNPVVGVWIALDPATPENGCMHVISGSHAEGPVVHFARRDWQICDDQIQTARDVMVPLEPGGILLFDGLIHHGTPTNRTNQRRRAVQYHYTGKQAIWTSPEARMAIFGSEGKDVEC